MNQRFSNADYCVVIREEDGVNKEVFKGSNNECFVWLLKHQPQSVHYATTVGEYSVVDAKEWNQKQQHAEDSN